MSDLYSREPLPAWRIVMYGVLAAAGVAALGYFQHDPHLYYFAGFSGILMAGVGFYLSWMRANVKRDAQGRFPKWVYWMVYVSLALKITWHVMDAFFKGKGFWK